MPTDPEVEFLTEGLTEQENISDLIVTIKDDGRVGALTGAHNMNLISTVDVARYCIKNYPNFLKLQSEAFDKLTQL